MKERLILVDSMRAFAIFSVVIGHLNYFTFDNCGSIVNQCINAYWMPLFFFISGMFAKEEISFRLITKRSYQLLLPFVAMGLIKCWYEGAPLSELFFSFHHAGYWFLLALFWAHILFMFSQCFNKVCKRLNPLVAESSGLVLVWCALNILLYIHLLPDWLGNILCVRHLVKLLPFYVLGKYYFRYRSCFSVRVRDIISAIALICFSIMLCAEHFYHQSYSMYFTILVGIFSGVVILQIFENLPSKIVENKSVTYCGQHTLEIYLLHYFFLPSRQWVYDNTWINYLIKSDAMGGGMP